MKRKEDLFDDDLDAVGEALSAAEDPAIVGKMWANGGQTHASITSIPKE